MSRKISRSAAAAAAAPGLPVWAAVLLAAWACLLLHHLGSRVPWARAAAVWSFSSWAIQPQALLRHAARLAGLAGLLLVIAGSGRALLGRLRVQADNAWEEAALSFGLGYGVWGTVFLLFGLAGFWSKGLFIGLGAAGLLPGALALRPLGRRLAVELREGPRPGPLAGIASAVFWAVWFYQLRFALIPETFYDALEYHLGMPNLFLNLGRIIAVPENSYSAIPSLPSMLYGWTLAFDHWGILACLLHCSLMLWLAAAFLGLCRRLGRAEAGPLACAIFYTTPVVMAESFRVSVGLEWALFQLCAFSGFLAALKHPAGSTERRGWLIIGGLFLGFTMGSKYPAWLLPAAFLPALFFVHRRPADGQVFPLTAREISVVALLALAALSPWIFKNLAFYGNPVYPFLHERLNAGALHRPDLSAVSPPRPRLETAAGFISWLAHPWTFLRPAGDMAETTGACYLLLLPLLFLARLTPLEKCLALLCLGAWLPLSAVTYLTRMFIPHLAALAVLLSCAARSFGPSGGRRAAEALCIFSLGATALGWYLLDVNQKEKLSVFLGPKSYSDFLGRTSVSYPTPPYAGIEYINAQPDLGAALVMGEGRTFYFRRPFVAATPDQRSILEVWSDASADGPALLKRFRQRDIRFILVNHGEMSRLRSKIRFSASGRAAFDAFWNRYTQKVFEVREFPDRFVVVYRVLTDEEASRPHPVDDLFEVYARK